MEHDGRQLFYMSAGRMMVVAVQTHPVLRIGQPRALNNRAQCGMAGGWEALTDRRRF